MTVILRSWLAFSALGAGILHLALVLGSPLPVAILLVPLGIAEFGWGVAVLVSGKFVLATVARGLALAPILIWAALLFIASAFDAPQIASSPTAIPMAVATLFDVVIAISLSVLLRRDRKPESAGHPPVDHVLPEAGQAALPYLGGLFVGGLAVSLLMTPALALTEAGLNNPHAAHNSGSEAPPVPGFSGHQGH